MMALGGALIDSGKVYVYQWLSSGIINFIGGIEGTVAGEKFGSSVTSNGVNFLVGAPEFSDVSMNNGAAYLYNLDVSQPSPFTFIQRVDGNTDGGITANRMLGVEVSLTADGVGSTMLVSGGPTKGAMQLKYGTPFYVLGDSILGTNGGDTSQSGNIAGLGFKGTSVELFYNRQDLGGGASPDWAFDRTGLDAANNADYGRDISIDGNGGIRVMANGNLPLGAAANSNNSRAYAYYTPCGTGGELIADQWAMIGINCLTNATINEIFADDLGTYGDNANWVMYKQTTQFGGHQPEYVEMVSSEGMVQGVGYWIITDGLGPNGTKWQLDAAMGITATGTPKIAVPDAGVSPRELAASSFSSNLATILSGGTSSNSNDDFRTMLSSPFLGEMDWSLAYMDLGAGLGALPLSNSSLAFYDDGSGPDLNAYVYTGVGEIYEAIPYATPGFETTIKSGQAYFVRFSGGLVTLIDNGDSVTLIPADLK